MRWRGATCALATIVLLAAAACGGSAVPTGSVPAVAPPSVAARSPAPSTDDPQTLLEIARRVHEAPGAIGVLDTGGTRTFLQAGTGDVAGTTLDETTRFRIASVTKPIVAALVMDAVDRGELRLDDVVGTLLPGVVRDAPAVTVRQLLDHTSGIFDEGNEGDPEAEIEGLADAELGPEARDLLARYKAGERVTAPDRVIVALAEAHDRYFAPGDGYHYSNVNYQLAAMVLEEATGRSLAELLQERMVEPLGLRHTTLAPADAGSPELRGYTRDAATAVLEDVTDDLSWFGNGGNGGIVSTPDEVLEMFRAIVTARLFPAPLVSEMEQPDGSYGLGLGTYVFRCGTFYGHGGLVNGTQSIALVSPDGGDGVVLALNLVSERDPRLTTLAESMLCGTP